MTETQHDEITQRVIDKMESEKLDKQYQVGEFHPTINNIVVPDMSSAFDDVSAKVSKVLSDNRYSNEHKRTAFSEARDNALAQIEDDYQTFSQRLEDTIAKLEPIVNYLPSVPSEDAAKLSYTKDALVSRWQTQDVSEMLSHWRLAIQNGDKMTARVYQDFAHAVMLDKYDPQQRVNGLKLPKPTSHPAYASLADETRHMLMSDKQRKQSAKLDATRKTLMSLKMAHSKAKAELTGATVNRQGEIVSGIRNDMMRRARW